MKKALSFALVLLILVSIPSQRTHATHFSCVSVTADKLSARMQVQGATVATEYIKVLDSAEPNTSYAKTTNNFSSQGTDKMTYIFEDLQPATTYKALVYNGAGDLVEELPGCSFKTKALANATNIPNPSSDPAVDVFVPKTATQDAPEKTGAFLLDVKLKNPLKVNTITEAIKFFVNTLIKIAIPFVVIFFLWAGLQFILAQGNETKLTKAKKMFWYTIIGTLLIFGAWAITNAIIGTVNSIVG